MIGMQTNKVLGKPLCRNLLRIPASTNYGRNADVLKQSLADHAEVLGTTSWYVLAQHPLHEILGEEDETHAAMEQLYGPDGCVREGFRDVLMHFQYEDEDSFRPMVEAAVDVFEAHDVHLQKVVGSDADFARYWFMLTLLNQIQKKTFFECAYRSKETAVFVRALSKFKKAAEAGETPPLFPVAQAAYALWDEVRKPSVFYELFARMMDLAEPWEENATDRVLFLRACDSGWNERKMRRRYF